MPPTPGGLAAARLVAETTFDAECTITRPAAGADTRDEVNLTSTPPAPTVVYSGPCLFRPRSTVTRAQGKPQGGEQTFIEDMRLRLPATVADVRLGDVVTCDASPNDPSLIDREYDVVRVIGGSLAVTRMLALSDRNRGPKE